MELIYFLKNVKKQVHGINTFKKTHVKTAPKDLMTKFKL